MLVSNKPKRAVSQAPLKETVCHAGCGKAVQYRTNPRTYCSDCRKRIRAEQVRQSMAAHRRKIGVPEVKGTIIHCERCGAEVVLNRSSAAKYCKPCSVEAGRDRARERVNRLSRERGAAQIGGLLECRHCHAVVARSAPRQSLCAECQKLNSQGRLPNLVAARKKYRKEVLQPRYKSDAAFREKQREHQKRSRVRRKVNPAFAINERMSAGIRQSLILGKQGYRWEKLVGYTLADLMAHLERQFLPGMTWENRSSWHIDHIVPISSFQFSDPTEPEFQAGWALSNLRPLWAEDNLTKRATRTHLI
jgi:hypothetical protein